MMEKILLLKDAAAFLHLHPTTLSEKARTGAIPAVKLGKRWIFSQRQLLAFIETQALQNACAQDTQSISCPPTSTNAKTHLIGGSNFQPYAANRAHYNAALAPRTSAKRKS
jgi:hypothetical protein